MASYPSIDVARSHLKQVRSAFLRLHKALLDSERTQYEQFYGRIPSPNAFLQLVLNHEWFNWLRPMSQFIIRIDETVGGKEPMTLAQADELLESAHKFIRVLEDGTPDEQRYFFAINRDPDVAILHVEVAQLLNSISQR